MSKEDPYAPFRDDPKARLWLLIRDALWERWDPIGVNDCHDAIDEYDNYVNPLWRKFEDSRATPESVFKYLWQVETGHMGLRGQKKKTKDFSRWLCDEVCRSEKSLEHPLDE